MYGRSLTRTFSTSCPSSIRFSNGVPLPPDYLKTGLDYPDGLGIVPPA
jgi:hypothetical protein